MAPIYVKRYGGGNKRPLDLQDDTDLTWEELSDYDTRADSSKRLIETLGMGKGKVIELGSPFNCKIKMVNSAYSVTTTSTDRNSAGYPKANYATMFISQQAVKIPNDFGYPFSAIWGQWSDTIFQSIKDDGLKDLILVQKYNYISNYSVSNKTVVTSLKECEQKISLPAYLNIDGTFLAPEREGHLYQSGNNYAFGIFRYIFNSSTNKFEDISSEERRLSRIAQNIYGEPVEYCTSTPDSTGITVSNYRSFTPKGCVGVDKEGNRCFIDYSQKEIYIRFMFSI